MEGRLSFRVESGLKERLFGLIERRYPKLDKSDVLREMIESATDLLESGNLDLFTGEGDTKSRARGQPRGKRSGGL